MKNELRRLFYQFTTSPNHIYRATILVGPKDSVWILYTTGPLIRGGHYRL